MFIFSLRCHKKTREIVITTLDLYNLFVAFIVCVNIITHDRICLHTGTVPATEKCENIHKDGFHDNADLGLQYASKKVEIMQTSVAAATSAALKSKKRKRLEDGKSARGERLLRSSDTLH